MGLAEVAVIQNPTGVYEVTVVAANIAASARTDIAGTWQDFALVILESPDLPTLPLRLAQYVGIEGVVRFGPLAAAALLATLPSLLLFVVIQRWLTSGLLSGAVKG